VRVEDLTDGQRDLGGAAQRLALDPGLDAGLIGSNDYRPA
jgi:hypothetical protein